MSQFDLSKEHPILIFIDVETTGLEWWKDNRDVIEFAYIVFKYNEATSKYERIEDGDWFVKIGYPIPQKIVDLTKITDEILVNEGIERVEFHTRLFDLFNRYKNALLGAYNTHFDAWYVITEMRKGSLNPDFMLENPMIDVLAIYRDRYSYPHKLKYAIDMMGVDAVNSHRAVDDIYATYEVFKQLMRQKYDIQKYINRFGYLRKYGINHEQLPHITYVPCGFNGLSEVAKNYDRENA